MVAPMVYAFQTNVRRILNACQLKPAKTRSVKNHVQQLHVQLDKNAFMAHALLKLARTIDFAPLRKLVLTVFVRRNARTLIVSLVIFAFMESV